MTLRPVRGDPRPRAGPPPDLLELARFTADYYLAPLGEVVRSMLPSDLAALGGPQRSGSPTRGAMAPPRGDAEAAVIEALREGGRMSVAELRSPGSACANLDEVSSLAEAGGSRARRGTPRSARYVTAVELAPGGLATHLAAAGRSAPGRRSIEYLAAHRPARHDGRGGRGRGLHAGGGAPADLARRAAPVHPGGAALPRPPHAGAQRPAAPIVLRPDQDAALRAADRGARPPRASRRSSSRG